MAVDSLPARRVWLDSFIMQRDPVTLGDYLQFLNALLDRGEEQTAIGYLPHHDQERRHDAPRLLREGNHYQVAARADGQPWPLHRPVRFITWFAAMHYARWLSEQTGLPWRLPHELEREKAARGADGRLCPWGNHLDAAFCHCIDSQPDVVEPRPVHSVELDVSPYGVRGLAGNSRDWCINRWRHEGPPLAGGRAIIVAADDDDPGYRSVRGGAYNSPLQRSRSAARLTLQPGLRRAAIGMRLVRSWPS